MESLFLPGILLFLATCFGFYYKKRSGLLKSKYSLDPLSFEFDLVFGEKATIILFSSAFCSQCRIAKSVITNKVKLFPEISYVEIDAESNLKLVRELNILSTPTTIILNQEGFEFARAVGVPKNFQLEKLLKSISS
jgi:hypothetical protein